jgi:hypothetical protein
MSVALVTNVIDTVSTYIVMFLLLVVLYPLFNAELLGVL